MCDIVSESVQTVQMLTAGGSFQSLLDEDNFIPILAIAVGALIAVVGIVTSTVKSVCVSRARELTKRELAAYVAEGTLDPDKAVAMINAGRMKVGDGCVTNSD
jgi:hypothetical protein